MTIDQKPLRVGVIGTGAMGEVHATNLHGRILGAQLAAVTDSDPVRASQVSSMNGDVPVFGDAVELIQSPNIDAVVIATPGFSHAELVLECLRAAKPVMCEKPLATSIEDVQKIIDAEIEIGRRLLQVGFCRRYDNQHIAVKHELSSGRIGRALMYKGWHRNMTMPGRTASTDVFMLDAAIHEFDSIRWLLGQELEEVYVKGVNTEPSLGKDVLDLILIQASLTGDCLATFDIYLCANYGYEIGFELVGENGTVSIGPPGPPVVRTNQSYSAEIEDGWSKRLSQAYLSEVQSWASSVSRGTPTGPSAWDGYMSLLGSVYGLKSLKSGNPERIPLHNKPPLYQTSDS